MKREPEQAGSSVVESTPTAATTSLDAEASAQTSDDHESESELIAATLAWSARRFGANAARFMRPTDAGGWLVISWLNGSISAHPADDAEAAMAWNVALGRKRLLVNRPRVSSGEGGSVRPISTRSYLGVPVICHDCILGVIEVAGDQRPDIESAAAAAQDDVDRFALRISFDTSLRPAPPLDADTVIALSGGTWPDEEIELSADDLALAAVIHEPMTIADAAQAACLSLDRGLEVSRTLERRGMVEVVERPPQPESSRCDG
jgi:GAF domain-containing protein